MIQTFIVWLLGPVISFFLGILIVAAIAGCVGYFCENEKWPWEKDK